MFTLKHLRKFYPVKDEEFMLLESAGSSLFAKFSGLHLASLPVSDYTRKYLGNYLKRLHYGVETAAYLIAQASAVSGKSIKDLSIIDHGGGSGITSLFARLCACKAVYYQDIFEVSVRDAGITATELGLKADAYFCGDEFLLKGLHADAVVSRNVIEHVYNPSALLLDLKRLKNPKLCLVFATTANLSNPATRLYTRRLQRKIETRGFRSVHGKGSDTQEAFFEIRKRALQEAFPDISKTRLDLLAKQSRGFLIDNFIHDLKNKDEGHIPEPIKDAYNTCNPINGNWAERLNPVDEYREWFRQAGMDFQCSNGFYDTHYRISSINLFTSFLNRIIAPDQAASRALSPFITLIGKSR